jgi:hypothetical protein
VENKIADTEQYYILLDEIQMVNDFESVLNEFLHIKNADIYVTGSNSKFLSSDIITEFRGRSMEIRVRPLNFAEYHKASGDSVEKDWSDYLVYGGMPFLFNFKDDESKSAYLKSLFDETYLKDIVDRNSLQGSSAIDELTNILASATGSRTNPAKLERTFLSATGTTVSAPTIRKYISYLTDSYIIQDVRRYDVKGKKYIGMLDKYYFVDTGLRNARLNFRQIEETHLMENILYNELAGMNYSVDIGVVELNAKDNRNRSFRKQLEIDFVLNKGSKRIYVQSALAIDSQEKYDQESRSLTKSGDSFKKIIIVKGYHKPNYTDDGIEIIGLYDFLLDTSIID